MNNVSEYIRESIRSRQTDQLARAIRGEEYSEEIFEAVSAEDFTKVLFDAIASTDSVNESSKNIIDCIRDAQNGSEVDEGVLGAAVGTVLGATIGPRLGQAMCNVLGITKGPLYDLLCSRLVTTAIALKLGMRA